MSGACPTYDCSTAESRRPAGFSVRSRKRQAQLFASIERTIHLGPSIPRYKRASRTGSRCASTGIASPLSSSRNNADGCFSPRPKGVPQTRPSVTALGKRGSYSLRAVHCLGTFGWALRVKNQVKWGTRTLSASLRALPPSIAHPLPFAFISPRLLISPSIPLRRIWESKLPR